MRYAFPPYVLPKQSLAEIAVPERELGNEKVRNWWAVPNLHELRL